MSISLKINYFYFKVTLSSTKNGEITFLHTKITSISMIREKFKEYRISDDAPE